VKQDHKQRVRKHFDRWAANYDNGHITAWLRAFQQRVIDVMSPQPHYRVLDVGCGSGWADILLSRTLTAGRACGIDLSPAMIERARSNAAGMPNVEFAVGDAERIPYGDGVFDAVMCSSSFHHYPNPVRALREFRRVLKAGGAVYILDTCRDSSALICLYDLAHKVLVRDHVRYYHTCEIKSFLHEALFCDVREEFRVQQFFLHGKLLTSITLITARKRRRGDPGVL